MSNQLSEAAARIKAEADRLAAGMTREEALSGLDEALGFASRIARADTLPNPSRSGFVVIATMLTGERYAYQRPFALQDRAHAEYFARTILRADCIEIEHWVKCDD